MTSSDYQQAAHRTSGSTRRRFLTTAGVLAAGSLGTAATADELAADTESGKRQTVADFRRVDVLVCGGGPAGVAAAVLAARQGVKVLLVERYGRLGGMAVQGLVGPLMGHSNSPFVDEVLRRIGGRQTDPNRLDLEYASLVRDAGAELLLHAWAAEAVTAGNRVTGARLTTKQGPMLIEAAVTVDATGDGDVAFSAGAPFEQGRPGDGLVQPVSIMYRIAGVDETKGFVCGSEQEARKVRVPEGSWEDPYGCLVPRDTDGLLLAGRCISGTHAAHASYRVQCIAMAIGAAAGAAAAVAVKHGVATAAIDVTSIQKQLIGSRTEAS